MRVLICGIMGKMGAVTETVARERGYDVIGADVKDNCNRLDKIEEKVDYLVDFSVKEALGEVLNYAIRTKTPCVLAVTGYDKNDLEAIKSASEKVPICLRSNYSEGIALVRKLVREALRSGVDADIEIVEYHHNGKIDAPSGTALSIADILQTATDYNIRVGRGGSGLRPKNEICLHSVRGGGIPGRHDILFCMPNETVTISHEAYSKRVFAEGALNAGVLLTKKTKGLYE